MTPGSCFTGANAGLCFAASSSNQAWRPCSRGGGAAPPPPCWRAGRHAYPNTPPGRRRRGARWRRSHTPTQATTPALASAGRGGGGRAAATRPAMLRPRRILDDLERRRARRRGRRQGAGATVQVAVASGWWWRWGCAAIEPPLVAGGDVRQDGLEGSSPPEDAPAVDVVPHCRVRHITDGALVLLLEEAGPGGVGVAIPLRQRLLLRHQLPTVGEAAVRRRGVAGPPQRLGLVEAEPTPLVEAYAYLKNWAKEIACLPRRELRADGMARGEIGPRHAELEEGYEAQSTGPEPDAGEEADMAMKVASVSRRSKHTWWSSEMACVVLGDNNEELAAEHNILNDRRGFSAKNTNCWTN
ncbi:hypothetical protein BRADI_1g28833v3 [Brachypodium distachyon]|uniref:Uncharacterized protein n=1 Tax=Brachypodium distachyon TaxID=15368 RepID=A0A2K2DLR5_BRADI|nr:hypothetical protein BRADI_1g28833v3 [Brachypodium distachyon]